jgi:hypothetical protein
MTQNSFTTATAVLFLTAASLLAGLARADTVPIRTRDAVEGKCSGDGDVFFPPSAAGVYACLKKDGSGVVCGGVTDDFKKTCDTWPADSKPSSRAPDKVHEAAKKKAADKAAKKK